MSKSIKFVKAIVVLSLGAIALTGCTALYSEGDAKILPTVRYMKDSSKGLCFAYVKSLTYNAKTVYSISQVDCKAVGL